MSNILFASFYNTDSTITIFRKMRTFISRKRLNRMMGFNATCTEIWFWRSFLLYNLYRR